MKQVETWCIQLEIAMWPVAIGNVPLTWEEKSGHLFKIQPHITAISATVGVEIGLSSCPTVQYISFCITAEYEFL